MWTDALTQLSSAQAVTSSAVSTNTIDLGASADIGSGSDLYVHFTVDQTALAAGAATVTFQLISSASANLSSPTVLAQSDAIGKAELTAGRRPITLPVPSTVKASAGRYLGAQYVVGTGPVTQGAFSATISESLVNTGKHYATSRVVA